MDAHHLLHGHGEHAEGIIIPDVLFGGEGQVLQVRQGAKVFGFEPHLIQALPVEGHQMVDPFHQGLKPA